MFKVITDYPVALDSPDHIVPCGAKNDNTVNLTFVSQLENYFGGQKLTCLDIGCAGGGHAISLLNRGHNSIGLEGSDYTVKNGLYNWPQYYNTNLFTCDVTKPYTILWNDEPAVFDCITAWEFMEHPLPECIDFIVEKVHSMLRPGGIFIGSCHTGPAGHALIQHHQTIEQLPWWDEKFAKHFSQRLLDRESSPIPTHLRTDPPGFGFMLIKD